MGFFQRKKQARFWSLVTAFLIVMQVVCGLQWPAIAGATGNTGAPPALAGSWQGWDKVQGTVMGRQFSLNVSGLTSMIMTSEQGLVDIPQVQNLYASGGNGQVTLTWDAVVGAAGYSVYRALIEGGDLQNVGNVTDTTWSDMSVQNGVKYYYTVTARTDNGESPLSEYAAATPSFPIQSVQITQQSTPITLGVGNTTSEIQVTLSIPGLTDDTALSGIEAPGLQAHLFYYKEGTDPQYALDTQLRYMLDTANGEKVYWAKFEPTQAGTYYYFAKVSTDNGESWSSSSLSYVDVNVDMNDFIAPEAPVLAAINVDSNQAQLNWTESSTDVYQFEIYRQAPGQDFRLISVQPRTATSYVDYTVSNDMQYTYKVAAVDASYNRAYSVAQSVTPKPQVASTITFANPGAQNFGTTPTLTATASSGLTPTFTSSTTGVCTITSGGTLTFISTGTCTINADQAGNSTYLAAPTVTRSFTVNAVVPGAPTVGSATAGDAQATVTFTAPANTGGGVITGYTVTASPGGITATGTSSPITVTGLTNGTAYTFTVTATNSAGTGAASAGSNSITPQAASTITFANPGAQNFSTTPTLTVIASSGLTPTFTSSTTGVCTITSEGALTFISTGTCTINADQAGNSAYLAAPTVTQSFTVNAVVPGAPTAGSVTAGDKQATVTFTAPVNTGGAVITGYTVTASPGGITATGTSSPITITGLTNGTAYTFTVTATNSMGTGAASNGVTETPHAVPIQPTYSTPVQTSSMPVQTPVMPEQKPATPQETSEAKPEPMVDAFNRSIVNEDNIVKIFESKAEEAKEANTAVDFADTQGHWAQETIDIFVQLKLINGYEDGTFRPNSPITRVEFAAMLNRVFQIGGSHTSTVLKDIDKSWAQKDIENLVATGVINGYGDGTFRPNQTITREEMVMMLSRLVNLNSLAKDTTKGRFNDLNNAYASGEIQSLAQAGIVSGKGDGKFEPKSNATRAEALQIILNVLELNPQLKKLLNSFS